MLRKINVNLKFNILRICNKFFADYYTGNTGLIHSMIGTPLTSDISSNIYFTNSDDRYHKTRYPLL